MRWQVIPKGRASDKHARGVAVIGFVVAMLIIGSMVLWLCQITSAVNTSFLGHFYSTGAMYSAESGIEMAMRELNQSPASDIDSDGTIGTISNNGTTADDPQLSTGAFYVEQTGLSPPTYRATGRPVQTVAPYGSYRRVLEIQTE